MAKEPVRTPGRATLQEVAEKAGVSMTTASLVLAGKATKRRISEDAHDRVRRAAAELNYTPNLLVRSLRKGRTQIISFYNGFRHRDSGDLYMDKLATAVQVAGGQYGYDILVHCNFNRNAQETYEFLNGGLADGILLFAPRQTDPILHMLRRSGLPVVLLNAKDSSGILPSVGDDGTMGMKLIADTLYDLGHRRIAVITGSGPDVRDADTRIGLLRHYLSLRKVTIPSEWLVDPSAGMLATIQGLLDCPEPPTAIFCWHDHAAYAALEVCDSLGISVPEQLSIIGYDGIRWPSATAHVAASVKVDLDLLASRGVRLLDQYIEGYEGPVIDESLPISLSPGTTLGPAPRP